MRRPQKYFLTKKCYEIRENFRYPEKYPKIRGKAENPRKGLKSEKKLKIQENAENHENPKKSRKSEKMLKIRKKNVENTSEKIKN